MESGAADGSSRALRIGVFFVIFLAAMALKWPARPDNGPYGVDGSNYFQMARHVAEGDGLVTSVSLYHIGYKQLPTPSHMTYPVWPLVLGWTGRLIGMKAAANALPPFFYALDLLLIYFFANRVSLLIRGTTRLFRGLAAVDFGHITTALLAFNNHFFTSTSFPYTESLGFGLLFSALLLTDRAVRSPKRTTYAAAATFVASLAFLTRTQMVIAVIGIVVTLAWYAVSDRSWRRAFIAGALAAVPGMALWYFGIFKAPNAPTADIHVFRMWVEPRTAAGFIAERLKGLAVSLDPLGSFSYFTTFGPAAVLPVVAGVLAMVLFFRGRRSFRAPGESFMVSAAVISGLGFFASLNLYHATFFLPWLFGYRHGLPYFLLIVAGAAYLLRDARPVVTTVVVGAIVVSIIFGVSAIFQFIAAPRQNGPTPAERQLAGWLDSQRPVPTVVTTNAQSLSVFSRANFHWMLCSDPPEQTRRMVQRLPIDYVIVYGNETGCPFANGVFDVLQPKFRFGSGPGVIYVLARRR